MAPEELIDTLLVAQEERMNMVAMDSSVRLMLSKCMSFSSMWITPDFAILILFLHKI